MVGGRCFAGLAMGATCFWTERRSGESCCMELVFLFANLEMRFTLLQRQRKPLPQDLDAIDVRPSVSPRSVLAHSTKE